MIKLHKTTLGFYLRSNMLLASSTLPQPMKHLVFMWTRPWRHRLWYWEPLLQASCGHGTNRHIEQSWWSCIPRVGTLVVHWLKLLIGGGAIPWTWDRHQWKSFKRKSFCRTFHGKPSACHRHLVCREVKRLALIGFKHVAYKTSVPLQYSFVHWIITFV